MVELVGDTNPAKQALGRSVKHLIERFLAYSVPRIEAACNAQRELLLRGVGSRGHAYVREIGLAEFSVDAFLHELAKPFSLQKPSAVTIDIVWSEYSAESHSVHRPG